MKKVLFISNFKDSIGGISGQVEILLKKFDHGNFESSLFNTKTNNFKRIFLPFKLLVKGKNFDIYHAHGCSFSGFYPIIVGVILGKLLKKKIIITYHGGGLKEFIEAYPRFVKYFFKQANVITVPSKYLLDVFEEYGIKALLLPNVIREDNVMFKRRIKLKPVFIVTRSLEVVYNIPMVIQAFKILKNKYNNAELYIVGNGTLKKELVKLVRQLGLEGVSFIGRVPNSEIGKVLNTADIFINPTNADNMPISLFEAFACGLPVVSTNVGGLPNFIEHKVNGFLIDQNDVNSLVESVYFILSNQDDMVKITENAFNTFKNFTWDHLKPDYHKLYSEI